MSGIVKVKPWRVVAAELAKLTRGCADEAEDCGQIDLSVDLDRIAARLELLSRTP